MPKEPEGSPLDRRAAPARHLRAGWVESLGPRSDSEGPVDADPTDAAAATSPLDKGAETSDREPGLFSRKLAGAVFVVASGGVFVEIVAVSRSWDWGVFAPGQYDSQPGAPAFVLLTSLLFTAGIALGVLFRRPARLGPPLLALVGTALVAFYSGGMRPRIVEPGGIQEGGRGDVLAFLDPDSAAISLGAGLIGVAFLWWVVTWFMAGDRRRNGPGLAVVWLSIVAVGTVLITNSESARVIGQWVEGRPMRRGRVRAADGSGGLGWAPRCVGDLWLEAANEEHASIATFRDLTLRLDAVGAPATLTARCRAAADDEERHARMCDRLAVRAGCGAVALERSRVHRRTVAAPIERPRQRVSHTELVWLAVESLVDGWMGEGFASRRLAMGSQMGNRSEDRAILRTMARDEQRHADLARDIVRWCADAGGVPVRLALRCARAQTPRRSRAPQSRAGFTRPSLNEVGLVDQDQGQELWKRYRRAAFDPR